MKLNIETIFRDRWQLCDETADNKNTLFHLRQLVPLGAAGLAIYGFVMGAEHSFLQGVSAAIKLPLLFALSGAITLPAFHFLGLLLGSRLFPLQTLVVFAHGAAVSAVLAGAFAPILLFFTLSGSSYPFMILAHVVALGFCGAAGTVTMTQNLAVLRAKNEAAIPTSARAVFPAWMVLFAFVGTQLAWMMRPFVGGSQEFVVLNTDGGNFYEAVISSLFSVLIGSIPPS